MQKNAFGLCLSAYFCKYNKTHVSIKIWNRYPKTKVYWYVASVSISVGQVGQ
jgi:hypothetical protein